MSRGVGLGAALIGLVCGFAIAAPVAAEHSASSWQAPVIIGDGFGAPQRRSPRHRGRYLRLRGGMANEVWLRFDVERVSPGLSFSDSRLRFRLRRPIQRALAIDLVLGLAVDAGMSAPSASRRVRQPHAVRVERVELRTGDTDFLLHDIVDALLEEARQNVQAGGDVRSVTLTMARADGSRRDRLDLLSVESGAGAEVEVCAGECVKVACLGDSNTESWRGKHLEDEVPEVWCEMLADLVGRPDWRAINYGLEGAFAGDLRDEEELLASIGVIVTPQRHLTGQFEIALREQRPDIVVAAAGINDLVFLPGLFDDAQLVDYLLSLHRRGRDLGIHTFIGLIQPLAPGVAIANVGERTMSINHALLERAGDLGPYLLDFHSGFAAGDFVDAVHLGPTGHTERARRVEDALRILLLR